MGIDTKTYWLTDRQSQCDFNFDFEESVGELGGGLLWFSREMLLWEADRSGWWQFGNLDEGERPPLKAANKRRLRKTEKTFCVCSSEL
jgi:hypothetical protein